MISFRDSLKIVFGARYVLIFEFRVLSVNYTLRGVLKKANKEGLGNPYGNNLIKLWGKNAGAQ